MRKKAKANFLVKRLGENYGWAICAACLIVLFCNSGLNTTGFAAYQPYLIKLGGLTNTQSSRSGGLVCWQQMVWGTGT